MLVFVTISLGTSRVCAQGLWITWFYPFGIWVWHSITANIKISMCTQHRDISYAFLRNQITFRKGMSKA